MCYQITLGVYKNSKLLKINRAAKEIGFIFKNKVSKNEDLMGEPVHAGYYRGQCNCETIAVFQGHRRPKTNLKKFKDEMRKAGRSEKAIQRDIRELDADNRYNVITEWTKFITGVLTTGLTESILMSFAWVTNKAAEKPKKMNVIHCDELTRGLFRRLKKNVLYKFIR